MAGPWLFSIAEGYGRTFDVNGGAIPVTVGAYRSLVANGRIVEDRWWRISQNWNRIEKGDELFVYTGDQALGVVGFAKIKSVRRRGSGWYLEPEFDLARCQMLLQCPIPAAVVRSWGRNMRRNPVDLEPVAVKLRPLLPWQPDGRLAEEIPEGTAY